MTPGAKPGVKVGLIAAAVVAALAVGGVAVANLTGPDDRTAAMPPVAATASPDPTTPVPVPVETASTATVAEVVLEPVNNQGTDPFGTNLATDDRDAAPVVDDDRDPVPTKVKPKKWTGGEVGPYGGTLSEKVCDKDLLVSFLTTHRSQAKAWVTAQNSDPNLRWKRGKLTVAQIPAYVASLTPVTLRYDTWVTNHLYQRGRAVPFGYAFQAGTKALVDEYGVIRARCKCGNPVIGPKYKAGTTRYKGKKWRGFDPNRVATIEPSREPLKAIPVVQKNGRVDYLKVGSKGLPSDRVPAPTANPSPTAPATTAPPATAPPATVPPSASVPASAPTQGTSTGSGTTLSTGAFSVTIPRDFDVFFKDPSDPHRIQLTTPSGGFLNIEAYNSSSKPQDALDIYRNSNNVCTRTGNASESGMAGKYSILLDRYPVSATCTGENAIAFTLGTDTILVVGTDVTEMQTAIATMTKP